MVRSYLAELKEKGGFSWAQIASMSGIPESTIRKIFDGSTPDPRFETLAKLVISMGGSLDDIAGHKKAEEIEDGAVLSLKQVYDARIAEIKANLHEQIDSLKRDKRILGIVCGTLICFLVAILIVDISLVSVGWIQR